MGQVHRGIHEELEEAANALIKQSLAGVTSCSAKSDILTPWKEQDRKNREVYVSEGVPDGTTRRGMFHRAWNPERPELNSRDGLARAGRGRMSPSLQAFVSEHGCLPEGDSD